MSKEFNEVATIVKLEIPSFWNVVFLNDDYTPMDFVIYVLVHIFNKSAEDAYNIMMNIHKNGRGVAGTYTYEIAQQKAIETLQLSEQNGHPLRITLEKDGN